MIPNQGHARPNQHMESSYICILSLLMGGHCSTTARDGYRCRRAHKHRIKIIVKLGLYTTSTSTCHCSAEFHLCLISDMQGRFLFAALYHPVGTRSWCSVLQQLIRSSVRQSFVSPCDIQSDAGICKLGIRITLRQ